MEFKSNLFYLQIGIYFLLSCQFIQSSNIKCEFKCTKFDFVCTKPSKNFSPKLPYALCTPSDYPRYPKTVEDVATIVKEAIKKRVAVKAFGNQLGQSDLICTKGIPMSIGALQSFEMNCDNTATVGAGVNIYDLTELLRKNGRALRTIPIYGNMTVSGAVLTGEQGNSIKFDASISSLVVKMTIVNSKGEIEVISCPEELKAFSLSLGLLGIMVNVTLQTVELRKMMVQNSIECDDILTNGKAIECAEKNDECTFNWFPASKEVVVSKKNFVSVKKPGNAISNDFLVSTSPNLAKITFKAKEAAFSLTESTCAEANSLGYTFLAIIEDYFKSSLVSQTPECQPIYTEDGSTVINPAIGFSNQISSSICYNKPTDAQAAVCADSHGDDSLTTLDSEFSIAVCDLPAFVETVRDIVTKTPLAVPLQGIRITFSGESDIYLATAYGRKTVNIEYRLWNRKDLFGHPSGSLAGYQTIAQVLVDKFNGRSNWGKSGLIYHNTKSLDAKLKPCARKKFIDAMNKYDLKGVFINSMGLRLTGKGTKVDVNPLQIHCALLSSCICSRNSDCGPTQICTKLRGYNYNVCKTKNEATKCNVDRSSFPPLSGVIKYLQTDVPRLAAAVLNKCSSEL